MNAIDIPYRPNYALVKSHVRSIRDEFDLVSPPVNPAEIARNLGIEVRFVRFNEQNKNISGFYDPDENVIYVNRDEYPLRKTFAIAHELGHAVLHRDWAKSDSYRVLMRDEQTDHGEAHEKEANAFAAHLLVPREMLDQYSSLGPNDLSRLFAVSLPMIKHRLSFEYGS